MVSSAPSAVVLPPGVADPGRLECHAGAGGRMLRFRAVAAPRPEHRLLCLHGIESHGAWLLPAALRLREHGCTSWLLDRRGSGLNRAPFPGDTPSADVLLEDVRRARAYLGDPPLHLVGLSWGGKLALAAALDQPRNLRSLILITPGLRARVGLTFAQRALVLLSMATGGAARFPVPIRPEMFTRAPHLLDWIRQDPWRNTRVTARLLLAGRALDRLIAARIGELQLPVLLFLAGNDQIIDNEGVLRLLSALPAGRLTVCAMPDATHSIQLEQVDAMVAEMLRFMNQGAQPC